MKETYLGDGLYASFDGWQIQLRAPNHDDGEQKVYLEPSVWKNLVEYVAVQKFTYGAGNEGNSDC